MWPIRRSRQIEHCKVDVLRSKTALAGLYLCTTSATRFETPCCRIPRPCTSGSVALFAGNDGKSVASFLSNERNMEAARDFFRECVVRPGVSYPRKINVDGNSATLRALRLLAEEDNRWRKVEVRSRRYLNNVVEQDHRAIKRRCASMLGLKSFCSAAITLAGIELAHRIRKGQYAVQRRDDEGSASLKKLWDVALNQDEMPHVCRGFSPPMHQISDVAKSTPEIDPETALLNPARYPRKVSFGGQSLHAAYAEGRPVLALLLPISRQAKDTFAWNVP
jgi:hypothetical protein